MMDPSPPPEPLPGPFSPAGSRGGGPWDAPLLNPLQGLWLLPCPPASLPQASGSQAPRASFHDPILFGNRSGP